MARVVAVHGAFNELSGPHELHGKWLPALRDGLWQAGAHIEPTDLRICFYGDLFRRDPDVESPEDIERSRAGAAEFLEQVGASDSVAAIGKFAADADRNRTLDLIATMNLRSDINDLINDRFVATVHPETRVLIAHSLGTVVAYSCLSAHPEWDIDTFVTLGSPLGGDMASALLPPAIDGRLPFPSCVRRWVNVQAVGDVVATRLDGRFTAPVEEHLVDNGHRAHDPVTYLNSRETGDAVARALGHRSDAR